MTKKKKYTQRNHPMRRCDDCVEHGRTDERISSVEKQTDAQWKLMRAMDKKLNMIFGAACLAPFVTPYLLSLLNFIFKLLSTSAKAAIGG
jgi:hypothetical protein